MNIFISFQDQDQGFFANITKQVTYINYLGEGMGGSLCLRDMQVVNVLQKKCLLYA